jgi:hypothetical protein
VDATAWAVGYTVVGEWLQYTRHFSGGRYDVWLNAATPYGSSAALQLELRTINTGAAAPGTGRRIGLLLLLLSHVRATANAAVDCSLAARTAAASVVLHVHQWYSELL